MHAYIFREDDIGPSFAAQFGDGTWRIWSTASSRPPGWYTPTHPWPAFGSGKDPQSNQAPDVQDALRQILRYGHSPLPHTLQRCEGTPGSFMPRIWRGCYDPQWSLDRYDSGDFRRSHPIEFRHSIVAATNLFSLLAELFRFVEPSESNYTTYGHRFREALILFCTEIEANWQGVLRGNVTDPLPDRLTTQHFVSLTAPMRLEHWAVRLKDHADMRDIAPFRGWDATAPTQSLQWYRAYNETKHNRELHFSSASLDAVLHAAAALHIMLCAQWSPVLFEVMGYGYQSPFELTAVPSWSPSTWYVPPNPDSDVSEWRARPYFASR